jgi:hypothetical protein
MDRKTIFVVTTLQIDEPSSQEYNVARKRSVGWFPTFGSAKDAVLGNHCDIYEAGHYNYAVIEEIHWGFYGNLGSEEVWFLWNEGYTETKRPQCLHSVAGFSLG